jgi:hypothetical protein
MNVVFENSTASTVDLMVANIRLAHENTNGKISNISQNIIFYFLNIKHGGLTVYMSNTAGVL